MDTMTESEARALAAVARQPDAAYAVLMGADRAAAERMAAALRERAFERRMSSDARSDREAR